MDPIMSIAAQARARAEAEAAARADAEAAAQAAAVKARPRPLKPALTPAPSVPAMAPRPASPAARQRAFLIASSRGSILAAAGVALQEAGANDDIDLSSDVAKVVMQLEADRRRLKEIKATERKVDAKRLMLPFYSGWRDGVLAAPAADLGALAPVFTTLMAWTIDVGDYLAALPMVEYAVINRLEMPAGFNRDPITFAIDQIAEAAIHAFDLGGDAAAGFEAAALPMLQDLVEDHHIDLHDEVEAKLQKAIGHAILAGANADDAADLRQRQEQALKAYQRAFEIDDRIGLKKAIERLQRDLKKTEPDTSDASATTSTDTPPSTGG